MIKSIINTDRYLVIREARTGDDARRMTVGRYRNVSRKSQIGFLLAYTIGSFISAKTKRGVEELVRWCLIQKQGPPGAY